MVLNGNDIRKLVEEKNLIEPFTDSNVNSGSYDVSISSSILKIKKTFKVILHVVKQKVLSKKVVC